MAPYSASSPRYTARARAEDYVQRFLKPTVHDVAILYADISGFSRVSEQILVDPRRVGALIDLWGERVCELICLLQCPDGTTRSRVFTYIRSGKSCAEFTDQFGTETR